MASSSNSAAKEFHLVFNEEQEKCRELVLSGENVVVFGQAGCGKTTFIEYITRDLRASGFTVQVTSMTAISAIPIGGTTLHKFLGIPENPLTIKKIHGFSKNCWKRIANTNVLIIDEASMCDEEMFEVLASVTLAAKNSVRATSAIFGGMQVVIFCDLRQLAPVIDDRRISFGIDDSGAAKLYNNTYFVSAQSFRDGNFSLIEFKKVYRQGDPRFRQLLQNMRHNKLTESDIQLLKSRCISNFPDADTENMIQLFPNNASVNATNKRKIAALPGALIQIPAIGDKNKANASALKDLRKIGLDIIETKIGAEMMIRKNLDAEKHLVNGKRGILRSVTNDAAGQIECLNLEITDKTGVAVIYPIKRYIYNIPASGAKLLQFPVTPAYAFTIYKAQGAEYDDDVFINFCITAEPHIHYVAISRVTDINKLYLKNFDAEKICIHPDLVEIENDKEKYFNSIIN